MSSRWLSVLVCGAGIFALSSRHWSLPVAGTAWVVLAKGAHLVEYGLLAASLAWALEPRLGRRALLGGVFLAIVFGATDEFHQSFVPGRHASLSDLIPDAIGAVSGVAALEMVRWIQRFWQPRLADASSEPIERAE